VIWCDAHFSVFRHCNEHGCTTPVEYEAKPPSMISLQAEHLYTEGGHYLIRQHDYSSFCYFGFGL